MKTNGIDLIIPCHNPPIYHMQRLFDSLDCQYDYVKNQLKIIVVDDNSDDLSYREYIKQNYNLNTVFKETCTDVHCPGNTRKEGMKYIDGDWVFFCDQDDYFEPYVLDKILNYLENANHTIYVLSTIMNSYNQEKSEYTKEFAHKQAWLHGKWYNVNELIKPYNIDFKQDLVTHEDIYFNSAVLNVLYMLEQDYDYYDINTYRWVENPDSLTRAQRNDRGYMYENFNDYIISASEPYWENARLSDGKNGIFVNQIMMTLLHCYFYYEAASFYNGPKDFKDVLQYIKDYMKQMMFDLNYDLDYIVNFVYMSPERYAGVREDCEICTGKCIPKTSFRDFVYRLGNKILEEAGIK